MAGEYSQSTSSSSSVPVQTPQSEWALQLSQLLGALTQNQYGWAMDQYNKGMGITDQNISQYLDLAGKGAGLAQNLLGRYENIFEPLMDQFVAQAGSYNSQARQQFMAGQAESTAGQADQAAMDSAQRSLQGFGVNPNSGRYQDLLLTSRMQDAATRAGAGTQASVNTANIGRQMTQQAAQMGQNLPGMTVNALQSAYTGLGGAENAILGMLNTGANLTNSAANFGNAAANANKLPTNASSSSQQSSSHPGQQQQPQQSGNKGGSGSGQSGNSGNQPSNNGMGGEGDWSQLQKAPNSTDPGSNGFMGPLQPNDFGGTVYGDNNPNAPSMGGNGPWADPNQPGSGAQGMGPWMDPNQPAQQPWDQQQTDQMWGQQPQDQPWDQQQTDQMWGQQPQDQPWDQQQTDQMWGQPQDQGSQDPNQWDQQQTDQMWGTDPNQYDPQPQDTSNDYSYDSGGDSGGDESFSSGGRVRGRGVLPTTGGNVPRSASPSQGRQTDDIPARLNAGEFVIPRDVTQHFGTKHFQDLIAKSRKLRTGMAGPPARPKMRPMLPQRPTFASHPMGR